jgi:hypothetical protein
MVYTKRIEEIPVRDTVKKLDVVKLKKHEIENQFYFIKKQCIVQNAYEPLNLLEVSDSLNTFITGGYLLDFKPNQILINSKDSLVKTSISQKLKLISNVHSFDSSLKSCFSCNLK